DHLGKFDEQADDGLFLGYSLVAKSFRVFKIRRQEMEETVHVTFNEDDETISQSNTESDAINFNENVSFPDDEFLEPRSAVTQYHVNTEYFPYIPAYENTPPSESHILMSLSPLKWSREKHIKLVNIIGEPLAGITTRSMIRDSDAALASECLYVNFLSEVEPKKLIEALEEEGWIIAMQEELNQFKRNKPTWVYGVLDGCEECILKWENFRGGPDESGVSVNETLFRGMIGLLMYLTASRPDIQFSTCLCVRYQANPKESHLVAVKRIFGKSTLGGCQMLGGKLVCWSEKKQSSVVMSSIEAEYVAATRCCAQVL
nr:hypothetical protein [Tanacetum cinerariifolium]